MNFFRNIYIKNNKIDYQGYIKAFKKEKRSILDNNKCTQFT